MHFCQFTWTQQAHTFQNGFWMIKNAESWFIFNSVIISIVKGQSSWIILSSASKFILIFEVEDLSECCLLQREFQSSFKTVYQLIDLILHSQLIPYCCSILKIILAGPPFPLRDENISLLAFLPCGQIIRIFILIWLVIIGTES